MVKHYLLRTRHLEAGLVEVPALSEEADRKRPPRPGLSTAEQDAGIAPLPGVRAAYSDEPMHAELSCNAYDGDNTDSIAPCGLQVVFSSTPRLSCDLLFPGESKTASGTDQEANVGVLGIESCQCAVNKQRRECILTNLL